LLKLPAAILAQEILAYTTTATNTKQQIELGLTASMVNIGGKDWEVTKQNLGDFLKEMQASIDTYTEVVEQRGYPQMAGKYSVSSQGECNGGDSDISKIFETVSADGRGTPLKEIALRQNAYAVELLIPRTDATDQPAEIAVPAVVVEDALIVGNLGYEAFNLWGTIKGKTIEIRFDEEQLKTLYGADSGSEDDWQTVRKCFVVLTPANP
jgi:hypothetical protein